MVQVNLTKSAIIDKAVAFFTSKDYSIQTQTESIVIFKTEKREVNWAIVFVLCCLGILPALIYYFFFSEFHRVTLSLAAEDKNTTVTATGNTGKAKKDAEEFTISLK